MYTFYETLSDDIKEAFAYIKQDKDQLLNYYA